MRRYVFSEFTPVNELLADDTVALLAAANAMVYVAVPPPLQERVCEIVAGLQSANIQVGLWPLLDDARGRWANRWNGIEFADYCRSLMGDLASQGLKPDELLVDLEPPIELTKEILRGRWRAQRRGTDEGREAIERLVREVRLDFCPVSAAVMPWAVCGRGALGWQRWMGTPIDGVGFDRVFVMAYTSLIEGYTRGGLRRNDAESLLAHWSGETKRRFGERAGVAIGVVGVGALGDEQTYRDRSELEADISLCTKIGLEHIALFNLKGALDRGGSSWLEALTCDEPREIPPLTVRARAALLMLSGLGRVAELLSR